MTDFVILQLPASPQGPPHASLLNSEAHFALLSPRKEHNPGWQNGWAPFPNCSWLAAQFWALRCFSPCVKETSANCSETLRRKKNITNAAFNNLIRAVLQLSHSRISPRSSRTRVSRAAEHSYSEEMDRQGKRQPWQPAEHFKESQLSRSHPSSPGTPASQGCGITGTI